MVKFSLSRHCLLCIVFRNSSTFVSRILYQSASFVVVTFLVTLSSFSCIFLFVVWFLNISHSLYIFPEMLFTENCLPLPFDRIALYLNIFSTLFSKSPMTLLTFYSYPLLTFHVPLPPPPQSTLFLGEVHAITEKSQMGYDLKCLMDETTFFWCGNGGAGKVQRWESGDQQSINSRFSAFEALGAICLLTPALGAPVKERCTNKV